MRTAFAQGILGSLILAAVTAAVGALWEIRSDLGSLNTKIAVIVEKVTRLESLEERVERLERVRSARR